MTRRKRNMSSSRKHKRLKNLNETKKAQKYEYGQDT